MKDTINCYENYNNTKKEGVTDAEYVEYVNILIDCINKISRAIFIQENWKVISSDFDGISRAWSNHWIFPGTLSNFFNEINLDKAQPSLEKLNVVYVYFNEAYKELINLFLEDYSLRAILIPYSNLNNDEIASINKSRKSFKESTEESLFKSARRMNILVEDNFRKSLFNHLRLMYGSLENRLVVLNSLRGKMESYGLKINENVNEFEYLNRGEYRDLISIPEFRNHYLKKLLSKWNSGEIDSYFSSFCDLNVKTSHGKKQEIIISDQNYVYQFLLNSIIFLKKDNDAYHTFLNEGFRFQQNDEDFSVYFSLNHPRQDTNRIEDDTKFPNLAKLSKINISMDELKEIYSYLKKYSEDNPLILDLKDSGFIKNYFSTDYRKFFAGLSLIKYLYELEGMDDFEMTISNGKGSFVEIYKP